MNAEEDLVKLRDDSLKAWCRLRAFIDRMDARDLLSPAVKDAARDLNSARTTDQVRRATRDLNAALDLTQAP